MIPEQDVSKIKTAIVLNDMLADAQARGNKYARISDRKIDIVNSFGKLSAETGVTKSNIVTLFNGKSGTKISTLIPILKALNKTFVDFAKRFEKVSDSDIQHFKEQTAKKKTTPAAKKKSRK